MSDPLGVAKKDKLDKIKDWDAMGVTPLRIFNILAQRQGAGTAGHNAFLVRTVKVIHGGFNAQNRCP